MRERLEQRLSELKEEFEKGKRAEAQALADLEAIRQQLLRISGAIQVLEEELSDTSKVPQGSPSLSSLKESETSGSEKPVAADRETVQTRRPE
jgi:hypothetical protein